MSNPRNASSFPDARTPGDPRLLDAIHRRTASVSGGGNSKFFSGTILTAKKSRFISSSAATITQPLTLVTSRPDYIPAGANVSSGNKPVWVTWGFCNDRLPTNWDDRVDVPTSGSYTKYIYLKAVLASTAASPTIAVTSCEWITKPDATPPVSPPWGESGARPANVHILLGTITATPNEAGGGSTIHVNNAGGGSIQISEFVSGITQAGVAGFAYTKAFSFQRYLNG